MIKTTLYFPDDIHRELKIRAAKEGTSITDIILEELGFDKLDNIPDKILPKPSLSKETQTRVRKSAPVKVKGVCKHGVMLGVGRCKHGCT